MQELTYKVLVKFNVPANEPERITNALSALEEVGEVVSVVATKRVNKKGE